MEPVQKPETNEPKLDMESLTEKQREELADPQKQEEFRQAQLIQLRRLQCPGCGETDLF